MILWGEKRQKGVVAGMMRSREEMLQLILQRAEDDDRIRAATMEGSSANANAKTDSFSDFDITYFVRDVREFTKDHAWISCFGELLIVQYPDDWYSHPYDYSSRDSFCYLMQFADGNRIDLTLVDLTRIEMQKSFSEPRRILLDKDGYEALQPVDKENVFFVQRPSEKEYLDTCNEFRWLSLYAAKGICRKELYYAKGITDCCFLPMLVRMLNWKAAMTHDFQISVGANSKYLKRYLSGEEMDRFSRVFSNGSYEDMREKLIFAYDYFAELAEEAAAYLGFPFDKQETERVRAFLMKRLDTSL